MKNIILLVVAIQGAGAFVIPSAFPTRTGQSLINPASLTSLSAKKGGKNSKSAKGFGEVPAAADPPTNKSPPPAATSPLEPQSYDQTFQEHRSEEDMALGKRELEKMRRDRAEKRNAELRKVQEVKKVDAMLKESPDAAVIPEKVAQRMGKRMLPFVGIPLFGSMGAFVLFWYLATYKNYEFQPVAVATTTIVILVIGLAGITYSVMSASWDPDREGSFIGTDEFSRNVQNLKDGLSRSRENALIRERMDNVSEAELNALEEQDRAREERAQSFAEKFKKELE